MRDYSKVSSTFWTGKTGKSLRGDFKTQVVALYLMTSHHATMIGVFHLPVLYLAHETGCSLEGASESLQTLCEGGFCTYEEASETVWVHEMARFQIEDQLKDGDKRIKGVRKLYDNLPAGLIKTGFLARYGRSFQLVDQGEITSPLEAPPKPVAVAVAVTEVNLLSGTPDLPQKVLLANGKAKFQEEATIVLEYLNAKAGKSFRAVKVNLELIAERMKEGATSDSCRRVIDRQCDAWKSDAKMSEYLRPATLFAKSNFWNYEGATSEVSQPVRYV